MIQPQVAMQISNKRLNKVLEKQVFEMLYQMLADSDDPKEIKLLLEDLLSGAEQTSMAKRLAIAVYLDKGRSYENIRENLKVSSATIASVAESMGNPGITAALQKVKAEEWAEGWSGKIERLVKRFLPA